ncbi:MAG: RdgB/HAM1 family non-canonical purine NTP pyrophosphatase [Gaiellales bacterium]
MRALLATTNVHKVSELQALLSLEIEARGVDVDETGATFAENAMLKARAAAALAPDGEIGLGEDSGIAVVALDGEPGIRSARFAGPDDAGRRRALLARMDGVEDRRAAYVCALAAVLPDGRELVVEGRLEGSVSEDERGTAGFGYDPIFVPEGERQTVAELGQAHKDEISHRARAAAGLARLLDLPAAT